MEITKIKKILNNELIENNNEIVIAISGEWGIGKTFFWKETFLKTHQYKDGLKDKKIAYVSLFGMDSLDAIKTSILLQVSQNNKTVSWIDKNIIKRIENIKSSLKIDDVSISLGLGTIGSLLSLFTSNDFENVIICFDDFERMSSKIDFKDVMGLISELKEQKQCKIIMLLNEEELNKVSNIEDKQYSELYALYKEKIIDIDLKFEPTVEESLTNALEKVKTKFNKDLLVSIFKIHKIKNIRILQQVLKEINNFSYILDKNYDNQVLDEFLRTSMSLYIAKIRDGKNIKDIIKDSKVDFTGMSDDEFNALDLEEIKNNMFYNNDNSIQTIILKFIDKDILEKDILLSILDEKQSNLERYAIQKNISDLWLKVHRNFTYSLHECHSELYSIFNRNKESLHKILTLGDFHHYINAIKDTQDVEDSFIMEIIKKYIDDFVYNESQISMDNTSTRKFIEENYNNLLEYWDRKRVEVLIDKIDITITEEIMKKIIEQSGWGNKDSFMLNSIESDKIYEYILSSEQFVETLIRFLRFIRSTTDFKGIKMNILASLEKLKNKNDDFAFKVDAIYKTLGINQNEAG